jgi:hypothetical protein
MGMARRASGWGADLIVSRWCGLVGLAQSETRFEWWIGPETPSSGRETSTHPAAEYWLVGSSDAPTSPSTSLVEIVTTR